MQRMDRLIDRILTAAIMLMPLSLLSCSDTGVPDGVAFRNYVVDFRLDGSDFRFKPEGGSVSATVSASDEVSWGLSDVPDWLSSSKLSGLGNGRFSLSAQANPSTEKGRVAAFYLEGSCELFNDRKTINASQERSKAWVSLNSTSVVLDGSAGRTCLPVSSNTSDWYVKVSSDGASSWLGASNQDGNILQLDYTANVLDVSRSATVTCYTADGAFSLNVIQRVAGIDVTAQVLSFDYKGGEYRIEINSEAPWTAGTSQSWLSLDTLFSDAGISSLVVTALPNASANDRKGYVYLYIGGTERIEIPVHQKGISISFESDEGADFDKVTFYWMKNDDDGIFNFKLKSNVPWCLTSVLPEWIDVSPKSGNGDCMVTIALQSNNTPDDRDFELCFGDALYGVNAKMQIVQWGRFFGSSLGGNPLQIDSKPSSWSVDINSNDFWTATTEYLPELKTGWVEWSDSAGFGWDTIYFNVADNPSSYGRSACLILQSRYAGVYDSLYVRQSGRYLKVDVDNVMFFAKGGASDPITVCTDGVVAVDIAEGGDWLSAEYDDVSHELVLTALANRLDSIRHGIVTLRLADLKDCTAELTAVVNVEQAFAGCTFIKVPYAEDVDWNLDTPAGTTLSVTGYSSDIDLNGGFGFGKGSSVGVGPYPDDTEYGGNDWSDVLDASRQNYGNDDGYDRNSSDSLEIGLHGYSDEDSYDNEEETDATGIELHGYSDDVDSMIMKYKIIEQ